MWPQSLIKVTIDSCYILLLILAMSRKNTSIEIASLFRAHLNKRANPWRDVQKKDNTMKDKRTAIEQEEYNELLELFTLKHGDEAKARVDAKYRVKGVKGGIAQLFQKQFPDHVFTRAIETHGSTQQEFTCTESGQKYVLRINGAKVVESN